MNPDVSRTSGRRARSIAASVDWLATAHSAGSYVQGSGVRPHHRSAIAASHHDATHINAEPPHHFGGVNGS